MKGPVAAIVSYPPTWVVVAAVLFAEWSLFSRFGPSLIMSVALILVGALMLFAWPIVLAMTGTLNRLQYPAPKIEEDDEDMLVGLLADLEAVGSERGVNQLRMLREKRDSLTEVLRRRLNAGELTYGRYVGTAQSVYLAGIDNLSEVSVALQSISAIDHDYIESRLDELTEANDSEGEEIIRERSSLEDRRSLHQTQMTRAAALLAQNESAMTVLDRTASAIADAPMGQTPTDAEAAMQQLEELAARAAKYSSTD